MMCSGGGGRCDYEALKYFDEYWCSDNTDPVERLYIQWGFSQFMPAKAMCSHVTNWNRTSSIKFRVDADMSCKLGFDIDLKSLKANEMQFCKEAVKEYNRLKPLIYSANIYRLASPYDGNHCVIQRVSDDKTHALAFAYDIHPRFMANLLPTKMEGLNPSALYTVKEVNLMPGEKSKLSFDNKTYTGDYLMKIGLMITSTNEMSSRIIEMTQK